MINIVKVSGVMTGTIKYGNYKIYMDDDEYEGFCNLSKEEQKEFIMNYGFPEVDNFIIDDFNVFEIKKL